ncbi:unnamed protein product, partial [Vitis vinifera]
MDYDDNDFQSQNLQLAGEGSAKFPPVLGPYALPNIYLKSKGPPTMNQGLTFEPTFNPIYSNHFLKNKKNTKTRLIINYFQNNNTQHRKEQFHTS